MFFICNFTQGGYMKNYNEEYNKLIDRFTIWVNQNDDIRIAVIVGSRARINEPADEWADLDLTIFSRNPEKYISSHEWIKNMGEYWITFTEDDALGFTKERRVLYEGGLDVDYVFYPSTESKNIFNYPEVRSVVQRGIRVLIDKDNEYGNIDIYNVKNLSLDKLNVSEDEIINLINDFWFHAVRAAKKILRGEIFIAKSNVDNYMKQNLLNLIEIHSKAKNGANYDTWHNGRYIEKWADPRIIEGLKTTYSYYDKKDIEHALFETMNLFRWISKEVCKYLNIKYPTIPDEKASDWIKSNLTNSNT